MGFSLGSFGSCSGGNLIVEQNASSPTGNGAAVNLFTTGDFSCTNVSVKNSLSIGFQNNFTKTVILKLKVDGSVSHGIFSKSNLSCNSIDINNASGIGLTVQQGAIISCPSVFIRNSGLEGLVNTDSRLDFGFVRITESNTNQNGFACKIGTTGTGRIGTLNISEVSSGLSGGVFFNGDLKGFVVDNIIILNATDNTSPEFAGVSYSSVNGLSVNNMKITGDDGVNSFQPLRLIGLQNVNIKAANITDTFNGNIVAGVISLANNVSFMNCFNDSGTNLAASTVSQFNCSGMAT